MPGTPSVKDTLELVNQYGKEKMALADLVNNGLKSITDGLNQNTVICQQMTANIKDGFDRIIKVQEKILNKMDDNEKRSEEVREKILNAVKDNKCKA